MKFLFWSSLLFVFYTYIGYPFILWIWANLRNKEVNKNYIEPFVSIIIAAYNEEIFIRQKLDSCLELNYPRDKFEIIVVSDGSDDRTNQIVNEYQNRGIRFFSYPDRKGKPTALNLGVKESKGEILFFTDARQIIDKNSLKELVANFNDPTVGSASGELMLITEGKNISSGGIGLYWKVEKWMRDRESQIHSMLGATGAIYALRKSLFTPIPPETILDDMLIPLKGILKGYRAVFDRSARAYDTSIKDLKEESKRKIRTLGGNFQLVKLETRLLIPFLNPVFFQFISHKIFRLIVPFAMGLCFFSNLFLSSTFYILTLIAQSLFYIGAILAPWAPKNHLGSMMNGARVIVEMNLAVLKGFYKFVRNSQVSAWEKADI
jgi:cellulose synthase/poly-beta-1,6-N-acetylglucosamine synthase-like glycosyltransferase